MRIPSPEIKHLLRDARQRQGRCMSSNGARRFRRFTVDKAGASGMFMTPLNSGAEAA
jgi:hypothetical protein